MSRVGLKPVPLPEKVDVAVGATELTVKGPKGTLVTPLPRGVRCNIADREVRFEREAEDGPTRALHGLARALVANAVTGVTTGFERRLEIIGVGYRAAVAGRKVTFSLGYSHPVEFPMPQGVDVAV